MTLHIITSLLNLSRTIWPDSSAIAVVAQPVRVKTRLSRDEMTTLFAAELGRRRT